MIFSMPYNVPLQGNAGGKRTLVILDDLQDQWTFSIFFQDLKNRAHQLTFHTPESDDLILKKYGDGLYDNILLLSPKIEKFRTITFDDLQEFVEEGGNLLIGTNKDINEELKDFIESFGIIFDKKGSEIIDHFYQEPSLDRTLQHTTILATKTIDSRAVLGYFNGQSEKTPILYKGIGHSIADDNVLAVRILRGNPSSYSYFPNKAMTTEGPFSAGDQTLLVSGIQGRNNARVVVSGSLDLFTNAFFGAILETTATSESGNRAFVDNISKWAFCEQGVLRFRDITHHKLDGTPPDVILHEKERPDLPITLYPDPEITRNSLVYRIKDDIVYSMIVEEYSLDEWKPFQADDMQLEFVMLDPYVRKTLTSDNSGKFTTTFTAPDSYGVFKFRVLYRRTGWSVLHAETQVSLRPFKHNEYERFILSAYPYYASAFSALIGLFFFSIFFLFSSD